MDELEYIVDDKAVDESQSQSGSNGNNGGGSAKEKPLIPLFVESARWIRGFEVPYSKVFYTILAYVPVAD